MIRSANSDDIPRLVELGVRFMRESRYGEHYSPDPGSMGVFVEGLIVSPHGLLLVQEDDTGVVGMIGALIMAHPYSGETVMSELFWYVIPRARGGGVRLLLAAEREARAAGATKSLFVSPNETVSALYERLGYRPIEQQFIKAL